MAINFIDEYVEELVKDEQEFRGDKSMTKTAKDLIRERLTMLTESRKVEQDAGTAVDGEPQTG